jgi:phage N-6-adenine-methyltransferase
MKKHGPTMTRHISSQVHSTPPDLVVAIEGRFDLVAVDLAATARNAVVPDFISRRQNSLKTDWTKLLAGRMGYLNPPFDPMRPWVNKCVEEAKKGARFVVISQASIDANWFWQMFPHCATFALTPRIKFVGNKTGFPKPLLLSAFNLIGHGVAEWEVGHLARWHWKRDTVTQ